jgi:hypothetical protein
LFATIEPQFVTNADLMARSMLLHSRPDTKRKTNRLQIIKSSLLRTLARSALAVLIAFRDFGRVLTLSQESIQPARRVAC